MTWEPRPLPEVTPETRPFWEAASNGSFLLRKCQNCDLVYYYPREYCPDCWSDDVKWIESKGEGAVYTYSSTDSLADWPEEALPLTVAYIAMAEGPRVLTNIVNCEPEDVHIGMDVSVEFVETELADVAIPVFSPNT